ncbi:DUF4291 family protein [Streptomyces sp. NPDC002788]
MQWARSGICVSTRCRTDRSLQLGLVGEAAARDADEWIVGIENVTPLATEIHGPVRAGQPESAAGLSPEERP